MPLRVVPAAGNTLHTAPGAVDTEMLRKAFPGFLAKAKPQDLAKLVVFWADAERSGILQGSTLEGFCNP